jgi:hypothetical protein
MQWQLFKDKSS